MQEELPTISFVIPTYNSEKTLERCLESIAKQDYPRDKIEIIVVDGGSKDRTIEIAQSFGAKIVYEKTRRPESATAIGYNYAQNDLIVNMPSDNILPFSEWLRIMVKPFMKCKNIVAAQPLRYTYRKNLGPLDRYFALFGVNDPIAYYLNKRDRLSWVERNWTLMGEAKDMGDFFLVIFNPKQTPTLGANGFICKREIIQKVSRDIFKFSHIDSCLDLIMMGYNTYAIVKTSIIHNTGESFFEYFRKRIRYSLIYFRDRGKRRYHLYDSQSRLDKINLLKFILFSLTLVKPVNDAIKGYKRIPDRAWFLHPIICWEILLTYGAVFITQVLSRGRF